MRRLRPSLTGFWHGIGAQLHEPSGPAGRLAGRLMGIANAKPNAVALAALDLTDGEVVIELGCGPGHALRSMLGSPHLDHAIGLDWSETMLAQAAQRNRHAVQAGRLSLIGGDFSNLPFADESADAMLAVNVVYFMSATAVREVRRVLCPGGRLVLYATHASVMRRWPFAGHDTHRLFDRERLAALLLEAGFAQESVRISDVDAGFGVSGLLAVSIK